MTLTMKYTLPKSLSHDYNLNTGWKVFDTKTDTEIWDAMSRADKCGKRFYEPEYDDRNWDTVSIPHGIGGGVNSFATANMDCGGGYRSVLLYRKKFSIPQEYNKVFFELEGIRQAAYVWVNGKKVGYYEAAIAPMGFDITSFVLPDKENVIAICNDGTTARGTERRIPFETVPAQEWGSSYTPDNYKTTVGGGVPYVWNTMDFNEPQIGLVYNAYIHIKGSVYQTLPLYNNLKTTGVYIYAKDFDVEKKKAVICVETEIRNESLHDGEYYIETVITDASDDVVARFESGVQTVKKASDAGVIYETAVEADVYSDENIKAPNGLTKVNTPDTVRICLENEVQNINFWSTDEPYLYNVYTILRDDRGNAADICKTVTGFRKIEYDRDRGLLINDKPVWLTGYAQRATNEWAVVGTATEWLQDYDMRLYKENNANYIRWMHVAPKPMAVRASDKYGVIAVCPAGDKEGRGLEGRQWSQRTEAMRDVMIYYRNSPSVVFWETGNSAVGSVENAMDMVRLRDALDPYGMRFIGARSATEPEEMDYERNYAGTMYGFYGEDAKRAMSVNGKYGPIIEKEYARDEAPRRVWDMYSPPDYGYVNKQVYKDGETGVKLDGYDFWSCTQEDAAVSNIREYESYYINRVGHGKSIYTGAAMMIWSDSNMHTRNTGTENCRTTGRVDPVRQTKEMFEATKAAQSPNAAAHIVGHWSYPAYSDDTYNCFGTVNTAIDEHHSYDRFTTDKKQKRDPKNKSVYVICSEHITTVELYMIEDGKKVLLGRNSSPENTFIYRFDGIDVTRGEAVIAKAYDKSGMMAAEDRIDRSYEAYAIRITAHTPPVWKADGADIAYFDIEVTDKNGVRCDVNYDKIYLSSEGEGVLLGGYNSGCGKGCFQHSPESEGVSHYFGGDKSGVSTIGKNYVYAENGTNRIFVRSTRNSGAFTLTVRMDNLPPVSATISSHNVK